MSRISSDVTVIGTVLSTNVNTILQEGLSLAGSLAALFQISPKLSMMYVVVSVIWVTGTRKFFAYTRELQSKILDGTATMNGVAEQSLSLVRLVRSSGTEWFERQKYYNEVSSPETPQQQQQPPAHHNHTHTPLHAHTHLPTRTPTRTLFCLAACKRSEPSSGGEGEGGSGAERGHTRGADMKRAMPDGGFGFAAQTSSTVGDELRIKMCWTLYLPVMTAFQVPPRQHHLTALVAGRHYSRQPSQPTSV